MITQQFVEKMEEIVGASYVRKSGADIELYSYDASLVSGKPGLIVFPSTTEEVSLILKEAKKAQIPSVARGFATNLSGGTISAEGLVICLTRFNKILDIDRDNKYLVAQTGVTNLEVQDALAPYGCFYAPDPASQKVSTLGGNVGENSGGPRCLKYGVTENHVLGMKMVMADGEIVDIAGPAYDPPGYDLRGLVVGSEGCLGVATEFTLRITNKTEDIITMLAVYDQIPDAAKTVSQIIAAGIVPNTLEMMDNTIIQAVEKGGSCGYPTDAAAVLIIEVEGVTVGLKEQAETIKEICMATNCREVRIAKDQAERDLLWKGRRGAFGAICNLSPNYLVNDGCVPRSRLPEALERVNKVSEQYGCPVGNVFHAGDGNLHPLLMFDSRNEKQLEQVHKAGWDIMEICADLGGTISGEHGIGHEKQEAMKMIFSGHDLNTQQAIKLALDSMNLMNPGKVIPLPPEGKNRLPESEPTTLKRLGGMEAAGVQEAVDAVLAAKKEKKSVRIEGGGSHTGCGNVLSKDVVAINSRKMTDIIEYDTDNMYITVGAGVKLSALQQKLGESSKWLPLRPPFSTEDSTIGGVVAMAAVGPERVAYGAPRDLLLGLQFIDGSGKMVTTGGKVVKNVAGYDMTRLLTGSWGTLGLITEATWMIATRPEICKVTTAVGTIESCCAAALKVTNANFLPVTTAVVPFDDAYQLMVTFEGNPEIVDHQIERCGKVMEESGLTDQSSREYPLVEGAHASIFGDIARNTYIFQADLVINRMQECFSEIAKIAEPKQNILDMGCGRLHAGFDGLTQEQWNKIDSLVDRCRGHVRLLRAPEDFRRTVDVFGAPHPEWKLTHQVKKAIDPEGLFLPGALPGKV